MKKVGSWWVPDGETHILGMNLDNYQSPARGLALKHCKKFDLALDIGAHIGLWSRPLCKAFKKVVAFEPAGAHRECFAANVKAENVVLEAEALGDSFGYVGFHLSEECSGGSHVEPIGDGVSVRPLDMYDFDTVDFIKMDVEGYEFHVLRGATETLAKHKPVVCIEQKKNIHFGLPQYAASDFLKSLGAKELGHVIDDWVFGW